MLWALMKWGTINTLLCNMYTEQLETVLEHISVTEGWRLSFTASETSRHLILCITDKLEIVVQHIKNIKTFCALQTSWRLSYGTSQPSRHFVRYRYVVDSCPAHQKHQDIYFVHRRHIGDRCPTCHKLQDILLCTLQTRCRPSFRTLQTSCRL